MNPIVIDTKTPLGKKIKFVSVGISKDVNRKALWHINICNNMSGDFLAVATDGCMLLSVALSEEELATLPVGLYSFDQTKTCLLLVPDTKGHTFPNWEQVIPDIKDRQRAPVLLSVERQGKVNAFFGSVQGCDRFFINAKYLNAIERVAKGKEWLASAPPTLGPLELVSGDKLAVIMPTRGAQ